MSWYISKKYDEMMEGGVKKVICSNRCCVPVFPFYSIAPKKFLDVNMGKRKSPCKMCSRECYKKKNCFECVVCAKLLHSECVPKKLLKTLTCSKMCEMKLLPFFSVRDDDFCDELILDHMIKI